MSPTRPTKNNTATIYKDTIENFVAVKKHMDKEFPKLKEWWIRVVRKPKRKRR